MNALSQNVANTNNIYAVNRISFAQHPHKSSNGRVQRLQQNTSHGSQQNHSNPPLPKAIISDRAGSLNNVQQRKRKVSYETIKTNLSKNNTSNNTTILNNQQASISNRNSSNSQISGMAGNAQISKSNNSRYRQLPPSSSQNLSNTIITQTNHKTPAQPICYDRELKLTIKRNKSESVVIPELKDLHRINYLISNCKSAAFELYQFLISNNWKYFRRWIQNTYKLQQTPTVGEQRKALIDIIDKLINIGNADFKNESFTKNDSKKELIQVNNSNNSSHRSSSYTKQSNISMNEQKSVLTNITNTYQIIKEQTPTSRQTNPKLPTGRQILRERPSSNHAKNNSSSTFQNYMKNQQSIASNHSTINYVECCGTPLHQQVLFKKSDIQELIKSKNVIEFIASYLRPLKNHEQNQLTQMIEEKRSIEKLIGTIIDITLEFKDREMYDELSLSFIKSDIFPSLIRLIVFCPIEQFEYKAVARIFELCACHQDGITVLSKYLKNIVEMADLFMQSNNDLVTIKYPAATVLLDLTANEGCIEKVAHLIKDKDLFDIILVELEEALKRNVDKKSPHKVYLNRYRDLMIGIVLNLTCNVESEEITEYMVRKNVIKVLKEILVDSRHDWPTNGAALALLQYAHLSLSNAEMFMRLDENQIQELLMKFVNECKKNETKRHLYETITLITMSKQKMVSISRILMQQCYASCA
eukprot:403363170